MKCRSIIPIQQTEYNEFIQSLQKDNKLVDNYVGDMSYNIKCKERVKKVRIL